MGTARVLIDLNDCNSAILFVFLRLLFFINRQFKLQAGLVDLGAVAFVPLFNDPIGVTHRLPPGI